MTLRVHSIHRYPVKGLSAERLDSVALRAGEALPHDRRFAIAHGGGRRTDAADGRWMPKGFFLQLMSNERLAALDTAFDPASGMLTIRRNGRQVSRGAITEPAGRAAVEQFLDAYMGRRARGGARLVESRGQPFSDARAPFVSIVNLASARDLGRVAGREVDPMRFRANVLVDGAPAWEELGWVGRVLRCGGVELRIEEVSGRCAAINVDPATGERDMALPRSMNHAYGHEDCGVYAVVARGGTLEAGAAAELLEAA